MWFSISAEVTENTQVIRSRCKAMPAVVVLDSRILRSRQSVTCWARRDVAKQLERSGVLFYRNFVWQWYVNPFALGFLHFPFPRIFILSSSFLRLACSDSALGLPESFIIRSDSFRTLRRAISPSEFSAFFGPREQKTKSILAINWRIMNPEVVPRYGYGGYGLDADCRPSLSEILHISGSNPWP